MARKKAEAKSAGIPIPDAVWKEIVQVEQARRMVEERERELRVMLEKVTTVATAASGLEGEYKIDWNEKTFIEKG